MKYTRAFSLILLSLLLVPLQGGAYWIIPYDFPTIQEGAYLAGPGDTLILAPGTYSEEVVVPRRMTIGSFYLLTGADYYIDCTILDGLDSLALIRFCDDDTCWISGLDLRRGAGKYAPWPNRYWGAAVSVAYEGCIMLDHLKIHDCRNGLEDQNYWEIVSCLDNTSIHLSDCRIYDNWHEGRTCNVIHCLSNREASFRNLEIRNVRGKALRVTYSSKTLLDSCVFAEVEGPAEYSLNLVSIYSDTLEAHNCLVTGNTGMLEKLLSFRGGLDSETYCDVSDITIRDNHLITEDYYNLDEAFWIERFQHIQVRRVAMFDNIFENMNDLTDSRGNAGLLVWLSSYGPGTATVDSVVVKDNYVVAKLWGIFAMSGVVVTSSHDYDSSRVNHVSRIEVTGNEYRRCDLVESDYEPPIAGPSGLRIGNGNYLVEDILVADNAADMGFLGRGIRYGAAPDYPDEPAYRVEFRNIEIYNNTWDYWDPSWISTPHSTGIYAVFDHHNPPCVEKLIFDNVSLHDHSLADRASGFSVGGPDSVLFRNCHLGNLGHGLSFVDGCGHIEFSNVLINDVSCLSPNIFWNFRYLMAFNEVGNIDFNNVTITGVEVEDLDSPQGYYEGKVIELYDNVDTLRMKNCIVRFATETADFLILENPESTFVDIQYSNISYGYPGLGNIDEDPLFIDPDAGDFRLQSASPCIDAGDPNPVYNDTEDPNNPGWPLPPAQGTLRCDMGCFGGPGVAEFWDFWEYMPVVDTDQWNAQPQTITLSQNYPNPFNPTTTIEFTLPYPQDVLLTVYNILGQQVDVLAAGAYSVGTHQVQFDASAGATGGSHLSSGLYFYRLVTQDGIVSRKMMLIK